MIITYYGHEFFKITAGELTVAVNPVSKESTKKSTRFGADLVLITDPTNNDVNGSEQMFYNGSTPFVISGAGEYEMKGIFVKGYSVEHRDTEGAMRKGSAVVYWMSFDGIAICFLGGLPSVNLPPALTSDLDDIGVLFVPIGGGDVTNAEQAHRIGVQVEPAFIVPMHFDDNTETLSALIKEGGEQSGDALDKLTIKKKDTADVTGHVVVLNAKT
jgi:L-ascorbate metabolism protein UlaG (beta-lactamase superfamily)